MRKFLIGFVLVIAVLFGITSNTAYAQGLNKSYINAEYWNSCSDANIVNFSFDNVGDGSLLFDVDNQNKSVYLKLNFANKIDLSQLRIHYDFYNENGEYHFAVDENGLCDFDGNEDSYFNIIYDICSTPMVGVQILDNSIANNVVITLYYNGRNYILVDNIVIDSTVVIESTTTTKSNITKKSQENKTEKPTKYTTKKYKYTTSNYKSGGSKGFVTPKATTTKAITADKSSTTEEIIVPPQANDNSNQHNVRYYSKYIGGGLLLIGVILFIVYFDRKNTPLDEK